ncbi:MAG: uroporphyrinogen-III C-methyltransferase [Pseudomonadales bacterium]|nr:uroporphyrinogen-III C-methyltransferase [Pseudomonadales bacterium]MCP5216271.1 uroporphyrinogen-III C-methyltransferase [Pseudomonadales bacterium]
MTEDKDSKLETASAGVDAKPKIQTQNVESRAKEPPLLSNPAASGSPVKKISRGPVWLALFVALFAVAAAGYTYWQLEQFRLTSQAQVKQSEQSYLENLEDKIQSQMQSQSTRLESSLADYRSQLVDQENAIAELRARIADSRRQIGEITHVSRKSWMLAEAEYLLRLANQRLIMEHESTSALALLGSADQILQDVDDVNLYRVRAEIAKEMAALRATGGVDVEGAFLALAALSDQLVALPLLSPHSRPDADNEEVAAITSFQKAVTRLEKLVTVRHRGQPVAPLLPPEQHYYVQQNLRLMLEQAQLALLQRKPLLFAQSLKKAEQWVQDYFELNASSGALLESLADLKRLQIAPQLPNISKSLELLKDYLSNPESQMEAEYSNENKSGRETP